jgi:asparagine synthase (glutamine-hydrolysing)
MCGIAGFVRTREALAQPDQLILEAMTRTLYHRGPDDEGLWTDADAGVALGHRRLAIIDLSAAGHQPMASPRGRWMMVFNGEIYNHLDLRDALARAGAAPTWRGHSDTETLLAGFEHWGVVGTLQRAVGMFAIALWDRQTRTLQLARDRFGEKPLYYGWTGEGRHAFVFGSELKALRAYPGFDNPVSREALAQYLRYTHVPAPHTIHEGLFKLEPGCLLILQAETQPWATVCRPGQTLPAGVSLQRWWQLQDMVRQSLSQPFESEGEALDAIESVLGRAVAQQSLADVPLGAFLSGGIDSTAIVALMQQQASRPVRTFTVGFDEEGYDESAYAAALARHLGTDHTELRVRPDDARELIPSLPQMYDEPFADSSQIPTHLVCKAARAHVTVALSGDAGDEMFGGYNRYVWGSRIWSKVGHWPAPARQMLSWSLRHAPLSMLEPLGRHVGVLNLVEKLQKTGRALDLANHADQLYRNLVSEWPDARQLVVWPGGAPAAPAWENMLDDPIPAELGQAAQRWIYQDTIGYMTDDILCKVDRASMATSLETRAPFLDHRVAEVAWRLPLHMKLRNGEGKWALRQLVYRHVPRELMERPKAGFRLPLGSWLRGPLKEWAGGLIDPARLRLEGYLQPERVQRIWLEHLKGKRDHTTTLWAVLMFQAWLETQ